LYPATSPSGTRRTFDPRTGRIVSRLHVHGGSGPITDLAASARAVWILVPDSAFPPGWRVLRLNPATNRVDPARAELPGNQMMGHLATVQAVAGHVWVTGNFKGIISVDQRTLRLHGATTASLSGGLVLGGGKAWALDEGGPRLTEIDPQNGRTIRTLTVPAPSPTGDDGVVAGPDAVWVFRGSELVQLNPANGQPQARMHVEPLAPALYAPALIAGGNLWYLAQTHHGVGLDRIAATRAA